MGDSFDSTAMTRRALMATGGLVGLQALSGCVSAAPPAASNGDAEATAESTQVTLPPLPSLPGVTVLGLGVDPRHVTRGRVVALEFSVERITWSDPALGGVFDHPATGRRYVVPAGVLFEPGQQESQTAFRVTEGSAAFERELAAEATLKGSYGSFSGKVSTSFQSSTKQRASWYHAQRSQVTKLWELWLAADASIDSTCMARFEALPEQPQTLSTYDRFVDDFGVFIIVRIDTGGRIDYNALVSSSEYNKKEEIRADVSASYNSFFGSSASLDASGSTGTDLSRFSQNSEITIEVAGGNVSEAAALVDNGGSTLDWSLTVPANPAVTRKELVHIWEVFPEGARRENLRRAAEKRIRQLAPQVPLTVVQIAGDGSAHINKITLGDSHQLTDPDVLLTDAVDALRIAILDARDLQLVSDEYFYVRSRTKREDDKKYPDVAGARAALGKVVPGTIGIVATRGILNQSDRLQDLIAQLQPELEALGARQAAEAASTTDTKDENYFFIAVPGSAAKDVVGGYDSKLDVVLGDDLQLGQYGLLLSRPES